MVEDLRGGRTQQSVERAVAVRADDDEVRALLDRGTCPPRASRRGCISRPTMSGGPATAPGAEAPGPNGGGIESIGPMNGDGELTTCPPSRADARREKALAAPTASEPETSCKKVRRPFTNGRCARSGRSQTAAAQEACLDHAVPRFMYQALQAQLVGESSWRKFAVCKLDFSGLREERSFAPHPITAPATQLNHNEAASPSIRTNRELLRKRCVAAQTLHRPHRRIGA